MSIKSWIIDKGLSFILESKVSPLGWVNGYKTIIGNILTVLSAAALAIQATLIETGICPAWEYCSYVDTTVLVIGLILGWFTKVVGQWHASVKESR